MEILDDDERINTGNYADFSSRFVAWLIDVVLLGIVSWILLPLFGIAILFTFRIFWFGNIIYMIYFIMMEASAKQGTIGKQVMKIKVVDEKGRRMEIGQSIIRNICKILSAAILLIGFIMIIFTDKRQGLHDIIAKTFVVKV